MAEWKHLLAGEERVMGYIEAVCISREKGELKMAVQEIALES